MDRLKSKNNCACKEIALGRVLCDATAAVARHVNSISLMLSNVLNVTNALIFPVCQKCRERSITPMLEHFQSFSDMQRRVNATRVKLTRNRTTRPYQSVSFGYACLIRASGRS